LSLIIGLGFGAVASLTYNNALSAARRSIVQQILPLNLDALSSGLQEDFIRPILFARAMAANTLLIDWLDAGEKPSAALQRYLASVQAQHGATTTFLVSERTRHYYHPRGILRTVSPAVPQDAWYFRVRAAAQPYELNLDRDTADLTRQTLFVNVRLVDRQGRFRGAVGLGQSSAQLSRLIRWAQQDHGIQVLFVNRQGQVLFNGERPAPSGMALASVPGLGPFAERIVASPRTAFSYDQGGQEVVARSQLIPELNWILVVRSTVKLPAEELLASGLQIALSALVTWLLAVLLVFQVTGRHHRKLETLACTDPLTGALNRTAFLPLFERLQQESRRTGLPLALALLDVDHFKGINDRFGHLTGDAVLRQVCQVIQSGIREQDLLFRWGGEEFLLLFPNLTADHAQAVSERLRSLIASEPVPQEHGCSAPTVSIGVTLVHPQEPPDQLLHRADQALYRAKREGRDRVVCA
jgi:diguanylate cyclase (GGDEF)-like protein